MQERFRRGEADAIVLYEPYLTAFTFNGDHHSIENTADLSIVFATLVAHKDAITTQSEQIAVLIEGYFKALNLLKESPETAFTRLLRWFRVDNRDPILSVKRKMVGFRYIDKEENKRLLSRGRDTLVHAIDESVKIWNQIGSLACPVNTPQLMQPKFLIGDSAT
jgi:ABC-type nitrate/sulfonate/bicarbonate transport system substrate-binding protein